MIRYNVKREAAWAVALAATLTAVFVPVAQAATVTDPGDVGPGTLRDAIDNASSGEVIEIGPGVNPVLSGGEIQIVENLTIRGQGASSTVVGAGLTSRIFSIDPGIQVFIEDLTLTGGRAPEGIMGAPNGLPGRSGGAISNASDLTLERVVISNSEGGAGGPGDDGVVPGNGGSGGNGGAIYHETGNLTINDSALIGNRGGSGGIPGIGGLAGGDGGRGGWGGAVFNGLGKVVITNTLIADNSSGDGADGTIAENGGDGGDSGRGGGLYTAGPVDLENVTIFGNSGGAAGDGANGTNGNGGDGGNGAHGGGLHVEFGDVSLIHTTLVGNDTGIPGMGGSAAGPGSPGSNGIDGLGGGVVESGADSPVFKNSIIAANTGAAGTENCAESVTDDGGNVVFPAANGCPGTMTAGDPLLDPAGLADNGGPTMTIATATGGAGIDLVPAAGSDCAATDQRGVVRPQRAACDSGAYELEPDPEPDGELQLGKVKRNKKKGTAKLVVSVPGPGKVVIKGKGLKKKAKTTNAAKTVNLKVAPGKKAKRKLNRKGKFKTTAKVIFTPGVGDREKAQKKVVLKKKGK